MDGNTSPRIKLDSDISQCVGCKRTIRFDELFGSHGLCSECLEDGFGGHHGG